jgi:hypothetical protein
MEAINCCGTVRQIKKECLMTEGNRLKQDDIKTTVKHDLAAVAWKINET